jgi:hypothetical protein
MGAHGAGPARRSAPPEKANRPGEVERVRWGGRKMVAARKRVSVWE